MLKRVPTRQFDHLHKRDKAWQMARAGYGAEDIAHRCGMEWEEAWAIVKQDDFRRMAAKNRGEDE